MYLKLGLPGDRWPSYYIFPFEWPDRDAAGRDAASRDAAHCDAAGRNAVGREAGKGIWVYQGATVKRARAYQGATRGVYSEAGQGVSGSHREWMYSEAGQGASGSHRGSHRVLRAAFSTPTNHFS